MILEGCFSWMWVISELIWDHFLSTFYTQVKKGKSFKTLCFTMVLNVFPCRNHPKYPPKYDLEKERPKSNQKVDFLMILDVVLGEKSTKIDSENRVEKKTKKRQKKGGNLKGPESAAVSAYPPLGPWPDAKLKTDCLKRTLFHTRRGDLGPFVDLAPEGVEGRGGEGKGPAGRKTHYVLQDGVNYPQILPKPPKIVQKLCFSLLVFLQCFSRQSPRPAAICKAQKRVEKQRTKFKNNGFM